MTDTAHSAAAARWGAIETIGRGLQAMPKLRVGFGVTLLLALVGAAGRVVIPVLLQQSIDRGFVGDEVDVELIAVMVAIGLAVTCVATFCQRMALARLGYGCEDALYGLRVRLFEHIHRLSLADHGEERKGALVARVTSDIETMAQFFAWGALSMLLDGTLVVMVAAVMLAYDWMLALVAFAVAAPLGFVLRRVQDRLVRAYDAARDRNSEVLTAVSEVVSGAETLHAYGAGPRYAERTKVASRRRSDTYIRAGMIGAFLFPSGEVFSVLTVSAVTTIGVVRGPAGGLTAGAMVGFIFLTYKFLEPIAEFTETLDQTQTAVAGLRRVLTVLETPVGPPEPVAPITLPPGRLAVDVDHVTFSYRSRAGEGDEPPALVDVTFRIPEGQQVAIVGETGSGKTTLGRLIGRFYDPAVGTIRLGGVPLGEVANADLRSRLVLVPQEPFLFDGGIVENLRFARPHLGTAEIERAIYALDLRDWFESLPDGLDTEVGPRGAQLSAGERQLVALVRAALVDPDVLVLDEATSSVDALTEVRLARALERLAAGRTSIAIAHRLSTAMRADRVLVLEHGRLVQDGTHAQLVAVDGAYSDMYEAWVASTAGEPSASPNSARRAEARGE